MKMNQFYAPDWDPVERIEEEIPDRGLFDQQRDREQLEQIRLEELARESMEPLTPRYGSAEEEITRAIEQIREEGLFERSQGINADDELREIEKAIEAQWEQEPVEDLYDLLPTKIP